MPELHCYKGYIFIKILGLTRILDSVPREDHALSLRSYRIAHCGWRSVKEFYIGK